MRQYSLKWVYKHIDLPYFVWNFELRVLQFDREGNIWESFINDPHTYQNCIQLWPQLVFNIYRSSHKISEQTHRFNVTIRLRSARTQVAENMLLHGFTFYNLKVKNNWFKLTLGTYRFISYGQHLQSISWQHAQMHCKQYRYRSQLLIVNTQLELQMLLSLLYYRDIFKEITTYADPLHIFQSMYVFIGLNANPVSALYVPFC